MRSCSSLILPLQPRSQFNAILAIIFARDQRASSRLVVVQDPALAPALIDLVADRQAILVRVFSCRLSLARRVPLIAVALRRDRRVDIDRRTRRKAPVS